MSRYDLYSTPIPLLPLKNVVIFPRNVVTMLVGRARSIQAVEEALTRDRRIIVTTHRDAEVDDPRPDDLHRVGTLVEIISVERQQGSNIQVILEGLARVSILSFDNSRPFYWVEAEPAVEEVVNENEGAILAGVVHDLIQRYSETKNKLNPEVLEMILQTTDPSHLADLATTQLITEAPRRQQFLENFNPIDRLEQLSIQLSTDVEMSELEQKIKDRVRSQIDKNQREYYLREQLKVIHDELSGEGGNEIEALRKQVEKKGLPEEAHEKVLREITRLERMPAVSAEATIVRNYIETVLAMPWHEQSVDNYDLDHAEAVLNADHYGLEHVKERVVEFLAVRALTKDIPEASGGNAILCLVGPPGVGKTSVGQSIARAMDREFVRVSLGGVRDEAEIRGHRRTYIGAYPGRVISALKNAGTTNPVVLLDEIDKLSSDYRGDPASALLEVLDPEQNAFFVDHFLDMPYDLSNVLFLTTANQLSGIPLPLLDRLEVIEIGGYTEEEKIGIAQHHLLPKQLESHGLSEDNLLISDRMWTEILRGYTREAGVRNLERQIATLCRKAAREIVRDGDREDDEDGKSLRLTQKRLEEFLGPKRYGYDQQFGEAMIGVAIGLGKTSIGGEIIPVEVATMPGTGKLTITGQAGEVMRESAHAALSYARSRAEQLGIAPDFQEKIDIHIHLPEGATPKDGPSAGITMATALISAIARRPIDHSIAMTGEITLRGRVLPIGGLKEKTLAAHRNGIRTVIAPADNERDLIKIPEKVQKDMTFIWVENMDQVVNMTLLADDIELSSPDPASQVEDAASIDLPLEDAHPDLPADAGFE
ncbi:endopeptidase La [soil metagenome]